MLERGYRRLLKSVLRSSRIDNKKRLLIEFLQAGETAKGDTRDLYVYEKTGTTPWGRFKGVKKEQRNSPVLS